MVMLIDPTQVTAVNYNFNYYKVIDGEHYYVRSLGRDGVLNAIDDTLPNPIENIGLVVNYNEK